jgi:tRNA A37 threonylcarbamoyladenosine synthetase subunit TsaC/SUA5/YrdC
VIDVTRTPAAIVRPGAVSADALREVLGEVASPR